MMIRYYSEDVLSPTVIEIIREAKRIVFGDEPIDFTPVAAPGKGILSFGKDAPGAIRTLTGPQVATQPFALSALVEAFELIRDRPETPAMPQPHVNPLWLPDFDRPVVVDIENAPDGSLLSIALCDGKSVWVYTENFEAVAKGLAQSYYIIGHNLKYDVKMIERNTGHRLNQFFDTMLARHVLHPASQGYLNLKDVARLVLGAPDWESDIKQYTGTGDRADYSKIPQDKLLQYNAYDVWYTWHLYERFKPLVENEPAFWHEMSASRTVYLPEFHGIAIDLAHIEALRADLTVEVAERRAKLPMANPGSWQQVLTALEEHGVPVARKPKEVSTVLWKQTQKSLARKGIVTSTGEEVLEGLADRVAFVPDLLAWRGATKALSTYCNAYLDKHQNGILYPTYNVHGTSTGRLSSSEPNQQQVPRDKRFRSIFVSRAENGLFVNADYSQIELRTMALLSEDEAMQAMFQPGMPDYFDSIIPNAFPEYTFEQYIELKETDPVLAKELRTTLKSVVYGLSFGRGAAAIAYATGTTPDYAQKVIDNYLAGFPKLAEWRQRIMEAAVDPAKRDVLVTPFGRRFESEVVTSRNRNSVVNAALAFLPQSTASDICLDAASRVVPRLPQGVLLVGLVHDAQMYDAMDPLQAEPLSAILREEMPAAGARVFGGTVPFDIEVEIGRCWS